MIPTPDPINEAAPPPVWILMPILANRDYTIAAIGDCLAQSVPVRLLLINQGVPDDFRAELEAIADQESDRVHVWSHQPPMLSLAATWNRALTFVWQAGGDRALVVNNDVRLHNNTVWILSQALDQAEALFVSAIGRATEEETLGWVCDLANLTASRGGPDFSCFLISNACHWKYPFDEGFIPAYCEDLDYHRRMMLGGDADRIFSIPVPYLHYAAGTLKAVGDAQRQAIERAIGEGSRRHYEEKWGGPVNHETFWTPYAQGANADDPALLTVFDALPESDDAGDSSIFRTRPARVPLAGETGLDLGKLL